MLVDSHCHIPMIEQEGGAERIISSARDNNVQHMLCVSIDLQSYPAIRSLAEKYECVSASAGVHPNTELEIEPDIAQLSSLGSEDCVVAIGETGLDYFRSKGDLSWQQERFRKHIRVAKDLNKPLIIHCRDAKEDVLKILKKENAAEVGGVMHCFVEDWDTAQRAMEMNFLISFSGIVTFKNAQEIKQVAKQVPEEMFLVETDSPYLAPMPHRGKQNEPAYVRYVAEHIAELRQQSFEHIAKLTTDNYFQLFSSALRH